MTNIDCVNSNKVHTLATLCGDKIKVNMSLLYLPTRVLRMALSMSSTWGRASFSSGIE